MNGACEDFGSAEQDEQGDDQRVQRDGLDQREAQHGHGKHIAACRRVAADRRDEGSKGTTFDVVSPQGEYLGGVIAPGLGISADALFDRAARLVRVDVRKPPQVIGRNTIESIQSGLFHGYASLVEGIIDRIRSELGTDAPVVATGGLAHVFRDDVRTLEAVNMDLALEGLRLIWEKNAQ